jgi:hypothetical protein
MEESEHASGMEESEHTNGIKERENRRVGWRRERTHEWDKGESGHGNGMEESEHTSGMKERTNTRVGIIHGSVRYGGENQHASAVAIIQYMASYNTTNS